MEGHLCLIQNRTLKFEEYIFLVVSFFSFIVQSLLIAFHNPHPAWFPQKLKETGCTHILALNHLAGWTLCYNARVLGSRAVRS